MKKVIFIMAIYLLSIPLMAQKLNLGDSSTLENFGVNIVKEKIDTYDTIALGLWYLKNNYNSKWRRVQNDEFELEDAKQWAFKQLVKKLDRAKPIDKNAEYDLYLNIKFTKYDFKLERFPVEALSADSYMSYSAKGEFVQRYANSKLSFENIDESINFIPMKKEEAKNFIKSKKSKYGDIDRSIVAHYVYIITNFEEGKEFTSDGIPMTINFTAKLKSLEFMDKNRKTIFQKINFK
jgi:hypothetical protein